MAAVSRVSAVGSSAANRRPLQSVELQGYKSFAARTVFEFGKTITAVVGPNGTGKSNIADAIRWVLGEQTYSLLRGRKTEDMIFSGSEVRPRAGMASVTIHFDNSDGWLPIDFSEVSISRRAHRDGQNEYLLNAQRVRLREISELLAGSGLAGRTYTIIGQGLVDSVLSLKAEDRRHLFEEAAGIGLHRVRREETVRRLDKTRRNLERAEDVLREVRPRLRGLERQAKRAKDYEQFREELKEALKLWYGYHWYRHQEALREAEARVREATDARETLLSELENTSEESQQAREGMDGLRLRHDEVAGRIADRKAEIEILRRKKAVAEARLEWSREREAGLMVQIRDGKAEHDRLQERLAAARESVRRRHLEVEEAGNQLTQDGSADAEEIDASIAELTRRLESLSAGVADLERARTQLEIALDRARVREKEQILGRIEAATRQGELRGLVGSLQGNLSCDPHYRKAIDAALDVYGQGMLFEDDPAVDRGLDWLEQIEAPGRISLIAASGEGLEQLKAVNDEGCLGSALDLVRVSAGFQAAAESILGRTLVATDRHAARRLMGALPLDAQVVTLAGEVFFAAGPVMRVGAEQAVSENRSEAQLMAELEEIARRLADAEREQATVLSAIEQASSLLGGGEQRLRGAREAEALSLQMQTQLEEQSEALKRDLLGHKRTLETGQAEQASLEEELEAIQGELSTLEEATQVETGEEAELASRLEAERLGRAEREARQDQVRSNLRSADSAYTGAEVELARRQQEMHGLEQRIQDDFGLVSFDPTDEVTVQEPLPLNGWVERLPRIIELPTGLERQINRLRGQLRRIGPVNGEAWEEYKEVKEREAFLSSQLEDLRDAEKQLADVISQLDELMRREFSTTFHAVAEAFQGYFSRLFDGGSARLSLAEGESLEDTGIEIEVRLPGRREQGLAMLSGGERSLTACALIFALLKLSPTPFCVLDEVDAMLDESNVIRFCEILRELAQDMQFFVITHNRQTIQQAELVYGVSLGRDNASEVIGLRLEEAAKELAA